MIGIDLFSGAGGMSLGARNAGVDVQIAVENDKYAAATYLRNHQPKLGVFTNDIRNFTKIDLFNPLQKEVVLFGGPPCQGFSTSNQRTRNLQNKNNWLFQEFIRVLKMYMPDYLVFENVRGILETEAGKFVDEIIKQFRLLGYQCEYKILNSSNFGVPQKRDRFFIIGSLNSAPPSFPSGNNEIVTVQEAIGDLCDLPNGHAVSYLEYQNNPNSCYSREMRKGLKGCENNLVTKNADFILERYKYIPQGGNWENIPDELMSNYTDKSRCHTGIYHRLLPDAPSIIIGNFRKNMLIHPWRDRGLSVREAARLQSFPDDFIFEGSIGFQQQQVGNAVPPRLAKAIFKKITKEY